MNPLDEAALARLRELAEKATLHGPIQPWRDFRDAFMPPTILALLDMVERQRKALRYISNFGAASGYGGMLMAERAREGLAASEPSTEERA